MARWHYRFPFMPLASAALACTHTQSQSCQRAVIRNVYGERLDEKVVVVVDSPQCNTQSVSHIKIELSGVHLHAHFNSFFFFLFFTRLPTCVDMKTWLRAPDDWRKVDEKEEFPQNSTGLVSERERERKSREMVFRNLLKCFERLSCTPNGIKIFLIIALNHF